MKQGTAKTILGSAKTEPKSYAVDEEYVAELGIHQFRYTSITLYEGRGLEAPMVGSTCYHSGSQGKHK